ncbi:hypothetical protein OR263_03405 [Streptomyces sp. NEAU-H22]|uniref:hypothetical protein n=1 Tax=Streptomyces sp. NEAU-H22 TaxID=2994655 RepID=UPI00224FD5CD|nr:hypothetical protein [Streptomyces sp. NEAU-H22]MCX3285781.1 hypothetical protein [Streptomyces sp. NEAU-H22]
MTRKKKRPADQYQLPPHVKEAGQAAARAAAWRPRPEVPKNRVILGITAVFLLCVGMSLALWLPPYYLVQDLRSRGVDSVTTVVGVDTKPKYVKVRFVSGPRAGSEVELTDYAGMYPATHAGAPLVVTYDREDPAHVLARAWVEDPPANLPAYGSSALAFALLACTTAVIWRRLWVLHTFGPEEPPASSRAGEMLGNKAVLDTKP